MGDDSSEEMGRAYKETRARIREIERRALQKLGGRASRPTTRIVIQDNADQFALSRSQIATILELLPRKVSKPIAEIRLCSNSKGDEPFEYDADAKTVYFSCPATGKSRHELAEVVEALLVGLARIRAGDTFFRPLGQDERRTYDEFVALWKAPVLDALFG